MSDPPAARTEATDPVERQMVADPARVRHRDKHVARLAASLMIPGSLLMLLASVAVAMGADPAAPRLAALLPFAAFVWAAYILLTRMVVRTAVTDEAVEVQWGLARHRVPLAAITGCEAKGVTGGPTAATGAGWALVANRGSVLLTWTEEGKTRSLALPANDPVVLAQQIDRARVGGTAVRVDVGTAEPEATTEEASAEREGARARR